jgi:Protein of unknown function (DUF3574)
MPTLTLAKLAVLAPLVAVLGLTAAATTTAGAAPPVRATPAAAEAAAPGAAPFHRTELYFGLSRPDGGEVTEEQFQHFLDVEVTKRFPEGLTLLSAQGQWQGGSGAVVKERSKLLILFYPLDDRQANREIEEIRRAYRDQFQQESVLRADSLERVAF